MSFVPKKNNGIVPNPFEGLYALAIRKPGFKGKLVNRVIREIRAKNVFSHRLHRLCGFLKEVAYERRLSLMKTMIKIPLVLELQKEGGWTLFDEN